MAKNNEKRGIKRARQEMENGGSDSDNEEPTAKKSSKETVADNLSFRDAAIKVLREAGKPLSAKEISERMIDQGLITTVGKTPDRTVAARIYSEIKAKANKSAFCQVGRGIFGLSNFTEEQKANVDTPQQQTVRKKKKASRKKKDKSEKKPEPTSKQAKTPPPILPPEQHHAPTTTTVPTFAAVPSNSDAPYNDSFGYLYLRYFLEITKRQECSDHSPEDDCFICKNGGDLICCDFPVCCKVYHLNCLGMDKVPEGKWYCPWHYCATCRSTNASTVAVHQCATCTTAYCEDHLPKENIKHFRKGYIICSKCLPYFAKEIDEDDE